MKKVSLLFSLLILFSCTKGGNWEKIQFDQDVLRFGLEGGRATITSTSTSSTGQIVDWWKVDCLSVVSSYNTEEIGRYIPGETAEIPGILTTKKSSPAALEITVSPSAGPRSMNIQIVGAWYYKATITIYQE